MKFLFNCALLLITLSTASLLSVNAQDFTLVQVATDITYKIERTIMRKDGQAVTFGKDSTQANLISPTGARSVLFTDMTLANVEHLYLGAFDQSRVATIIGFNNTSRTVQYSLYDSQGNQLTTITLEGTLQVAQHLGGSHLGEYGVMTKIDNSHFKLYTFNAEGLLSGERDLIDYPIFDQTITAQRGRITDFSLSRGGGDTLAILSSPNLGTSARELSIHTPDGSIVSGTTISGTQVLFNPRFSSDGTFTIQRAEFSMFERIIEIHQNVFEDLIPEIVISDDIGQLTSPLFLQDIFTRTIGLSTSSSTSELRLETIPSGENSLSTSTSENINGTPSYIWQNQISPFGIVAPMDSEGSILAFLAFDGTVSTITSKKKANGFIIQNPVRQEFIIQIDDTKSQVAEIVNLNGQKLGTLNLPRAGENGEIRIPRPSYLLSGSYVLRVGDRSGLFIVK